MVRWRKIVTRLIPIGYIMTKIKVAPKYNTNRKISSMAYRWLKYANMHNAYTSTNNICKVVAKDTKMTTNQKLQIMEFRWHLNLDLLASSEKYYAPHSSSAVVTPQFGQLKLHCILTVPFLKNLTLSTFPLDYEVRCPTHTNHCYTHIRTWEQLTKSG